MQLLARIIYAVIVTVLALVALLLMVLAGISGIIALVAFLLGSWAMGLAYGVGTAVFLAALVFYAVHAWRSARGQDLLDKEAAIRRLLCILSGCAGTVLALLLMPVMMIMDMPLHVWDGIGLVATFSAAFAVLTWIALWLKVELPRTLVDFDIFGGD